MPVVNTHFEDVGVREDDEGYLPAIRREEGSVHVSEMRTEALGMLKKVRA